MDKISYIHTTEKIEKLAPLDVVIDKINDLLEQNPGQKNYDDRVEFWIAGGAVLSAITDKPTADYDTYSSNPSLMVERLKSRIDTLEEYDHGMFFQMWLGNKRIQITLQVFDTAASILDQFDFTIVAAAYDGKTLIHHPRFWQDVATKTIHIARVIFPVKALMRVIKYTSRGYTPALATMSELVQMLGSYGR